MVATRIRRRQRRGLRGPDRPGAIVRARTGPEFAAAAHTALAASVATGAASATMWGAANVRITFVASSDRAAMPPGRCSA